MFDRIDRVLKLTAYLSFAIFLLLRLYSDYSGFGRPKTAEEIEAGLVGRDLSTPGLDMPKNVNKLIFSLSTTCRFCSASAPFYRKLLTEVLPRNAIEAIALLPEEKALAEAYVRDVIQAPFDSVVTGRATGVSGTPTILLVDGGGKIVKAWVGLLSPQQEATVIDAVRAQVGGGLRGEARK